MIEYHIIKANGEQNMVRVGELFVRHIHCYDNGETLRLALGVDHMLPTFGYKRGAGAARATIGKGDVEVDSGSGIYEKYDILRHAHGGDMLSRDINAAHTFDYSINIDPITAYFSSSNNAALWSTIKQKYSTKDGKVNWTAAVNTAINQLLAPLYELLTKSDISHKTNEKADLDDDAILELEALFNELLDAETKIEEELTEFAAVESSIKAEDTKIDDNAANEPAKAQAITEAKIYANTNTQNNPTVTSKAQNTQHTSIKDAINEYKNSDITIKNKITQDYFTARNIRNDGQAVQSYIIEEFIIDALITKQLAKPLLSLGKIATTWLKDKYKEFIAEKNIDKHTIDEAKYSDVESIINEFQKLKNSKLTDHEGGTWDGHAITKHTGKEVRFLSKRIHEELSLKEVTSYPDTETADRFIKAILAKRTTKILKWIKKADINDPKNDQPFSTSFKENTGYGLKKGENVLNYKNKAVVVLRKTKDGIKIITSYPID